MGPLYAAIVQTAGIILFGLAILAVRTIRDLKDWRNAPHASYRAALTPRLRHHLAEQVERLPLAVTVLILAVAGTGLLWGAMHALEIGVVLIWTGIVTVVLHAHQAASSELHARPSWSRQPNRQVAA